MLAQHTVGSLRVHPLPAAWRSHSLRDGGLPQSEHSKSPRRELQASYQLLPGPSSLPRPLLKEATKAGADLGERMSLPPPPHFQEGGKE